MFPSPELRSNLRVAAIAVALCGAALIGTADARSSDRGKPLDIDAAHQVCGLGANDSCTYTDATLVQGSLRVKAAKAEVQMTNGDMTRILMSGGVSLDQDMDDGTRINATSANVDYNLQTEVVIFTGHVVVTQQRGTLSGERVVYNMKSGQIESGGAGSGRVKMRILPKSAQGSSKGMP